MDINAQYANTGYGPQLMVLDIGHNQKAVVVEPDSAFWAVVEKDAITDVLSGDFIREYSSKADEMKAEMNHLRFQLAPSAVYLNPTERCNFNCNYCYLPEVMRKNGKDMTKEDLFRILDRLSLYFQSVMDKDSTPQIIFHGSEPMISKDAMFQAIEKYADRFLFGIQTNGTLLTDEAIQFLKEKNVSIGISLDAPDEKTANSLRKNWNGDGAFIHIANVMEKLHDYRGFSVITTVTANNVKTLPEMIEFYHVNHVQTVMLNPVRLTQERSWSLKPDNSIMAEYFIKALDKSYSLYQETGRKVVISNFANTLASIIGPTGRQLMCDISPCGGGRCFFAVSALGDIFPCSEFIGFPQYKGGNIFSDSIEKSLDSDPFKLITKRKVEEIEPCKRCAVRHFCGAPCPSEVKAVSGTFHAPSPYCSFYEEQIRHAFRVIADESQEAYMWDGWNEQTDISFDMTQSL